MIKKNFVAIGSLFLGYSLISLVGILLLPFCSSFLEYLIPAHFASFLLMSGLLLMWQKCYRKEALHHDERKAKLFRWVKLLFRIMMVLYVIVYLLFLMMMLNHEGLDLVNPYQIPG